MAGCNSFQGSYSTSGQSVEFSELTMTLMACVDDQGIMDLEQRYFTALQQAQSYEIGSDQLVITAAEGLRLVFNPH
jgi:heat shock protein HslJ